MKESGTRAPRGGDLLAGTFAGGNALTLPAWFTVRQARAVLHLKKKSYALILDGPRGSRAVGLGALADAADDQVLASCATPLGPALPARLRLDEALQRMNAHHRPLVPVVVDGLVVGIVSRDELSAAVANAFAFERRSAERLAA